MRTAATVIKASCRVLPFRNYRVPIAVAVSPLHMPSEAKANVS